MNQVIDIPNLSRMICSEEITLQKRLKLAQEQINAREQELELIQRWEGLIKAKIRQENENKSLAILKDKELDQTWNRVGKDDTDIPITLKESDMIKIILACGIETEGRAGGFFWNLEEGNESRILLWKRITPEK